MSPVQPTTVWEQFRINQADIEFLTSVFLEQETPLGNQDLALRLIENRIRRDEDQLRKTLKRRPIYQPRLAFEVGTELVLPQHNYAVGKVIDERVGHNPEHGDFKVIEVEIDGRGRQELASGLLSPHKLNVEGDAVQVALDRLRPDAKAIFEQYSESIVEELEAALVDQEDALFIGGKWFLKSLLATVNVGHLHLAEAILDLAGGAPMTTADILGQLDFAPELSPTLREFSMNAALSQDERFDNVGAVGQVRWFLRRLQPPEINQTPPRLRYDPESYDANALGDELRALELELCDELSPLPTPEKIPSEVNVIMIYPHRRTGTLGLTPALARMLPVSEESPRVLVNMIDGQTNESFPVWVLRDGKYLFGLSDFYRRHRIPIGAYLSIRKTSDPLTFIVNFRAHRARTEYIRLAIPNQGKLRFDNFKRSIGAEYDELLILGAEDIDGVDAVWTQSQGRRRKVIDIMSELVAELGRLNPQNAVHAKTLYSAVNVVRRCPPGPIFAALATRSEFRHVGGPYWRLSE